MSRDYDRDDDRRDRDDDDRPRRRDRDYDDRPKKKGGGMVILFVILGAVLLLCVLPCGGVIWWGMDVYNKMTGTAEDFLAKVGAGDYSGAYNSTTQAYKSRKTLEQFTADMKAAKLDKYQAKSFTVTASNSVNTSHRMSGQAKLTDGSSVPVTIVIEQSPGGFTFTVDDITTSGTGVSTPATPPTAK